MKNIPDAMNKNIDMSYSEPGVPVTLAQLLAYHDERFVYVAYQAVLGRAPDIEGMKYYLSRIRGGISKIEVLRQLRSSNEGQQSNAKIAGLDKAIKRSLRLNTPIIGSLYRFAGFKFIGESNERNIRAVGNKLDQLDRQARERFSSIDVMLDELRQEMRNLGKKIDQHGAAPSAAAPAQTNAGAAHVGNLTGITVSADALTRLPVAHVSPEDGREYHLRNERVRHAEYIDAIAESGLFDAVFYTSTYSIDPVFAADPILHYVLIGEPKGLQPNPDFWPNAYLQINLDVATAGLSPFKHFLTVGRFEGRRSRPLPPVEGGINSTPVPVVRGRAFSNPKRVAVCLHIYYVDLWDELKETLGRLKEEEFDLFVSLVDRGRPLEPLKKRILSAYPDARVFVFPNHGRDIFSFVCMASAGLFDPYEAVCKIHTKKSPHREDGEHWRNHLIDGVIPRKGSDKLVARFLNDPGVGIVVADGQIYEGDRWWGGNNKHKVADLLHRVEIRHALDQLIFPAGSIYWLKRPIINLIRGLQLNEDDFEVEDSQVDGTTAHAFERILGYLAEAANLSMLQTTEVLELKSPATPIKKGARAANKPFVSCFYLPQYHTIPENDEWWGAGYTEWIGAARAKPQFGGHYQPVVPVGTGYYDLRDPDVIGRQFALAKSHGISAFCMYYYSFDHGRRLLEAPLENLLAKKDVDVCYYLCWANESWTRNWDGLSGEMLMPQTYLPGCEEDIARDTARHFADPRYYRVDATAPRFVIYRPDDIPDVVGFVNRLRAAWKALGFDEVNLGAVMFHLSEGLGEDVASSFDFVIEMPPHGLVGASDYIVGGDNPDVHFPVNSNFRGVIYSYNKVIDNSIKREFPTAIKNKVIRGVMPSWDNTARRGNRAHICFGANPARFGYWVDSLLQQASGNGELMVNAWNEWGEKAMMEPGCQYGTGYLDALQDALKRRG